MKARSRRSAPTQPGAKGANREAKICARRIADPSRAASKHRWEHEDARSLERIRSRDGFLDIACLLTSCAFAGCLSLILSVRAPRFALLSPPVQYTFNCGSMELSGKTVTADKRKGKVVLSMEDDGLLRFQWRLRHSDNNEQQYFVSLGKQPQRA